ncbi:MAG: UDP-N-acetylmuramoyl-L-alanine--D-glutamate ligase [Myxococcales bacterium]|nr:UDP-N-acetylmuramoyl-L-alanine--D-glutamate ligase [Myxococcales bacterium]
MSPQGGRTPTDWAGRRVAVWGAARSGVAAANLLVELGAQVVLSDLKPVVEWDVPGLDPRVRCEGGGNTLAGADVLVPSPGLGPVLPVMQQALATPGLTLVSEVELAASVSAAPLVAITGTDGKSTTTLMTGAVLQAGGLPVEVAGNIGTPLSERARHVGADGVLVAEISEFQLWSCGHLRPHVAVITNLADDHADYFGHDPDRLADSVRRVLRDQRDGDVAVVRADDRAVGGWPVNAGVERVGFGPLPADTGWGFRDGWLTLDGAPVVAEAALALKGPHNVANAQAALAVGLAFGVPLAPMLAALADFQGLPHRLQRVRERAGVTWLDDSKATNAHAAAVGLRAVAGPLVVITGGYDKGLDLQGFCDLLATRARHVVLTGPTADRTEGLLAGRVAVSRAGDMAQAVAQAAQAAQPGDSVVLSPAASSFDAYRSYAHRGQVFQAEVKALP